MRYELLLTLAVCAGTLPVVAGADDCAQPSPEATWQAYLDASLARDAVLAARCLTRELQVDTATFRVVATDMGVATLEIIGSAGYPGNAAAEAERLRQGLVEIYERNGIAEVMTEVRESLQDLAWDGTPEIVDEEVEEKIEAAVDRRDPLRLIGDLSSFEKKELSAIRETGEEPRQLPIDSLQDLKIEGNVAVARASGQSARFRRIDGLWYIEEKPLTW